ncbi:MAG: phosphoribosylformylglycinamidine synthase subunit PurS [Acidimicrobiales bacterium]
MKFSVVVEVVGLEEIADPQGQTIERALPALGFEGIEHVRVGKVVRFDLDAADEAAARERSEELCRRLLANPVIERADVSVSAAGGAP